MDGGPITGQPDTGFTHDNGKNIVINQNIQDKTTVAASVTADDGGYEQMFIRNIATGVTQHLSTALADILIKYDVDIQQELKHQVDDFNIYNDIIYFHTPNYFVVDRVAFDGEVITRNSFTNNYLTINTLSSVVNVSSPFFFETRDYSLMCVITAVSANINASLLMPVFYNINNNTASITRLEILNVGPSAFENVLPVKFVKISKPILTYNSRNDVYGVVSTVFDANNLGYIYQILFKYDEKNILIKGVKLISLINHGSVETINWYDAQDMHQFEINYVPYAEATININNDQGCITIW